MNDYYCQHLGCEEDFYVLGFKSEVGSIQEAKISLKYGSNLCRYSYNGLSIIDYDPELIRASDFSGTPVLYPTPNRVENGVFFYRDRAFQQVKRGRRIFEHGLVYDEKWELVDLFADGESACLSTRITWTEDSPLFKAFPFPHTLTLIFCLRDGAMEISYEIVNKGFDEIPYGFGLHPYFQKLSGDNKTIIFVPVSHVMKMTEALLPTGKVFQVEDTEFDLCVEDNIGNLNLDHVFLRAGGDSRAIIHYADQGIQVEISATNDFSYFVVYTPPGMPYFCIESQTCSTNAHNLFHKGYRAESGLKFVHPGEPKVGKVRYSVINH